MLIIGFMSGSFMGQQMQFLELLPKYKCSYSFPITKENSFDCFPFDKNETLAFCKNDKLYHEVDYTNPLSIHNWIEDLKPDLTCKLFSFKILRY